MFARLAAGILVPFLLALPAPARLPDAALIDERGIPTIAPMIAEIDDAVVSISTVASVPGAAPPFFRDPFFGPFRLPEEELPRERRRGAGSGVIVDAAAGHILTNSHVVENADTIRVALRDGRRFEAELVGRDPATDIAVLRIEADDLTEIEMGASARLRVGDFVVAIGNPFGLGQTVTGGIVSALGRSGINPQGYEDFIQTDASINPGNSGGALVTLDGRLVGINTAILSPAGGNVGVGFAVPIDMARAVMQQILEHGEVRRGRIGVMIRDLTPDLSEALGIEALRGAVVVSVEPGTPAEAAGLAPGDVILAVDGAPVEDSAELRSRVGVQPPGAEVEIGYLRDGERRRAALRLAPSEPKGPAAAGPAAAALDGVRLAPLVPGLPGHGEVEGVAVLEVAADSVAARAGLRPGDVITAVNRRPVRTPRGVARALAGTPGAVALTLWRDGRPLLLVLRS